jgi:hypothetical protein
MQNSDGFTLIEVDKDVWTFEAGLTATFTGSFKQVVIFAMYRYHFALKEIELATKAMIDNNHNAASFGMMGTFIYSHVRPKVEKWVI